ncbi:MAG TPA: SDR family oxidoreductase [Pseudomonadales bacterium]|nr:SDR family oxidoreductase [Pseudomonadales bacterium]
MSDRFKGKGAIVTGAASGIGLASVKKLADEGCVIVMVDVNPDGAKVAETVAGTHFIACDVADPAAVSDMVRAANDWLVSQDRKLDVLFNNAGIGSFSQTPDLSVEEWQRVIAVDLHSVFYACRVAIPVMRNNGGGVIVNTASISGMFGDYGFSAYNAAKGAVLNYTRSLALDHGGDNIRVNALCPGIIRTGLTQGIENAGGLLEHWESLIPLGRAGRADEMANVVAFLCSDEASYITGAVIAADGGMTAKTGQPNIFSWQA